MNGLKELQLDQTYKNKRNTICNTGSTINRIFYSLSDIFFSELDQIQFFDTDHCRIIITTVIKSFQQNAFYVNNVEIKYEVNIARCNTTNHSYTIMFFVEKVSFFGKVCF